MRIEVDATIRFAPADDGVNHRLSRIESMLAQLITQGNQIMANIHDVEAALNDATAKITDMESVEDSLLALMTTINQQLKDALANSDPTQALAQVAAISAKIDADKQKMADAVTANTPAA